MFTPPSFSLPQSSSHHLRLLTHARSWFLLFSLPLSRSLPPPVLVAQWRRCYIWIPVHCYTVVMLALASQAWSDPNRSAVHYTWIVGGETGLRGWKKKNEQVGCGRGGKSERQRRVKIALTDGRSAAGLHLRSSYCQPLTANKTEAGFP